MKDKNHRDAEQAPTAGRERVKTVREMPAEVRKRKLAEKLSNQKRKEACERLGKEQFPEQCR